MTTPNPYQSPLTDVFNTINKAFETTQKKFEDRDNAYQKSVKAHYDVRIMVEKALKENRIEVQLAQDILKILHPLTCNGPENKP